MCTWSANFVDSSLRRSDGMASEIAIQSAWFCSTCVTSASTLRPKRSSIASGLPAGCASFDHSLKNVLRTIFICLFGSYWAHLYGPVPAGGMSRFLTGVEAGRMNANGIASLSRNSGSAVARWNVIWLPLTTTPWERSHDFGFLTQASPPWMTLYQLPALGLLPILNRRSNVALTSFAVTVLPSENLMFGRSVNAHVLPLSVGLGISVARSGTSFVPSAPPTRLNATSPSWVMMRNCHSC